MDLGNSHNFYLLLLSLVIASLASYMSLLLLEKNLSGKKKYLRNTLMAGVIYGSGIWAMHFLAMLSAPMPFPHTYKLNVLMASMIIAIVFSFASFWVMSYYFQKAKHLMVSSLLLSTAIISMHYTGLAAMHINGSVQFHGIIILLSSILTFMSVFWSVKLFKKGMEKDAGYLKNISALFYGGSILLMHFTSMEGVHYYPINSPLSYTRFTSPEALSLIVVTITCLLIVAAFIFTIYKKRVADQAAKWEEEKYKSLFHHNPEGIFTFDVKGRLLTVNPAGEELLGYCEDELKGTSYRQLVAEKYIKKTKENFFQTLKGRAQEYHIRAVRKDGSQRCLAIKNIPMIWKGDIIGVYGLCQDVTELNQAQKKLQSANHKMKTLIENLQFGVLKEDANRNFVLANNEIFNIFGSPFSPEKLTGRNITDFSLRLSHVFHDPDKETRRIEHLIQERKLASDEILLKNGKIIRRSYIPLSSEGSYEGHFWKIEDITEEKKIEQAMISAKEEAVKANQAKSEFLSKMSHEMRTPLNAMLGFAQVLEYDEEDPLSDSQRQKVGEILEGGWHLLNLMNEVLDLSKIESGHTVFNLQNTEWKSILSRAISLVQKQAEAKGVEIQTHLTGDEPNIITVDPFRFQQVLINLLTNGIKYNIKDGLIHIAARCERDMLYLTFTDSGPGIAEDDLPIIFEPFSRGKSTSEQIEGTGIGLSITKMIVEKMGGEITVISQPENGSSFTVSFPIAPSQRPAADSQDRMRKSYLFTSRKVLYIEDRASNAAFMEQLFKDIEGIELTVVHTPQEGVLLAKSMVPDLILMDLQLSGMSGLDVFNILKRMDDTKSIPVVAVSAAAMGKDIEWALAKGFTDYVTKPIDISHFMQMLYEQLEKDKDTVG